MYVHFIRFVSEIGEIQQWIHQPTPSTHPYVNYVSQIEIGMSVQQTPEGAQHLKVLHFRSAFARGLVVSLASYAFSLHVLVGIQLHSLLPCSKTTFGTFHSLRKQAQMEADHGPGASIHASLVAQMKHLHLPCHGL